MHDTPNESALETRIAQLVKYMSIGLVCLIIVGVMSGITFAKVNSEKDVAQTNSQVQAETTKQSSFCSIYPDDEVCKMARSIAANPTQTVVPKDGTNGTNGQDGRGVTKFSKSAEGDLIVEYTDGTTQNVGRVVGNKGLDGINGTDGRGILSAVVESGNLIIGFTDGTSQNLGMVVGPAGKPGADGATGPQGAPGEAGKDGISVTDLQVDNEGNVNVSYSDGTTRPAGHIIVNTIRAVSCEVDTLTLTMADGSTLSTTADCTPDSAPVDTTGKPTTTP